MVKAIINDFAENCYIVSNDQKAYVIDPGSNYEAMHQYIQDNNLTLEGVLLTHGHYDHICGINKLLERYEATIYIHQDERDFLFDPNLNLSAYMSDRFKVLDKLHIQVIDDTKTFVLGDETIRVLHTPGHSRGSVSYLYQNMVFSGDLLFKETVGRTDLPTGDQAVLEASIKKLYDQLKDNTLVYPGHGQFTTIAHEKNNNMFVKSAI